MSTLAPYHYSPLPSPHHIRLLELSSCSDRGDPLTGTLRSVNIVDNDDVDDEDPLPYVALSYRWSEGTSEELLLDNKGIIEISQDLDAALRRFRYSSALRWIWVDAICINQQDNMEKSTQIPLMAQIYRGASRVMIWLGNRAEDADLLRRTKSLIQKAKARAEFVEMDLTTPATEATTTLIASLSLSMSQLGRLAWFTRRWVLQELALNANGELCCGQTELPWPQLVGVLSYSKARDEHQVYYQPKASGRLDPNQQEPGLRRIQHLWDLWWKTMISPRTRSAVVHSGMEDHEIPALMDSCSDLECTDGRDRIAALLALSRDAQGPTAFRVDYADSVEQTYVKFAETLVRTGHLAWLLHQRFQREKERDSRGTILPSWVPDWRLRMVASPLHPTSNYMKIPASDIQASNNTPGVHLLTTYFWSLAADFWDYPFVRDKHRVSQKTPAVVGPPFLEIIWKNHPFPEGTSLAERVALVLVDLWPRIVARLSEDAKTCRRKMWCSLLLHVVHNVFSHGGHLELELFEYDDCPAFGEEDVNDLEVLTRYIISRFQDTKVWQDRQNSEGLVECLVFCQEAFDCLSTGSVCGMACVQASFYDQVAVGDKVLLADLGHFDIAYLCNWDFECRRSTYIVREQHPVAPKWFVDLATDGLESLEQSSSHRTNSCYDPDLASKLVSPGVYEFVAPCQVFSSTQWEHVHIDHFNHFNRYDSRRVRHSDKVRSIWIR